MHKHTLLTNANTSTCTARDVLNGMLPLAVSTFSNGLSQSLCAIYKHISMWPGREREPGEERERSQREMRTDEGGSMREGEQRDREGAVMETDKKRPKKNKTKTVRQTN